MAVYLEVWTGARRCSLLAIFGAIHGLYSISKTYSLARMETIKNDYTTHNQTWYAIRYGDRISSCWPTGQQSETQETVQKQDMMMGSFGPQAAPKIGMRGDEMGKWRGLKLLN